MAFCASTSAPNRDFPEGGEVGGGDLDGDGFFVPSVPNGEADPAMDANPDAANADEDVCGTSVEGSFKADFVDVRLLNGETADVFEKPVED